MSAMSLKRAFGQISGLTLISRILGFVRDICFAHFLGAGSAADAFLVAFKLPNLFINNSVSQKVPSFASPSPTRQIILSLFIDNLLPRAKPAAKGIPWPRDPDPKINLSSFGICGKCP